MKMIKQRLMGLVLIALTALIVWIASQGTTVEDRDATAALITGPLGLYMLITKKNIFYNGEMEDSRGQRFRRPYKFTPCKGAKLYTITRRKLHYGKKEDHRGPGPQELGGRERRAATDR